MIRPAGLGAVALALGVAWGGSACAGTEAPTPAPASPSCIEQVRENGRLRAGDPSEPQSGLSTVVLTVRGQDLRAEVARSGKERNIGLMLRDSLEVDAGMLFVYPDDRPRSFWMRNTCVALTIAYLDSSGTIVSMSDMAPLDESPVPSRFPARYALEMTQGWFARKGVVVGDRVVGLPTDAR